MHFCITSLKNFYNKLLTNKDIKRNKFDDFRIVLNDATDVLERIPQSNLIDIDKIVDYKLISLITPALTLCQYNNTELLVISLDLLQNLIANKFLCKIANQQRKDVNLTISQEIIKILCDLQVLAKTNEKIQLSIIKIMQPMVCDESNQVHGVDITKLLNFGISILCTSQSHSNKSVAFASLSQMISLIFQRLENNTIQYAQTLTESQKISGSVCIESERETPAGSKYKSDSVIASYETNSQLDDVSKNTDYVEERDLSRKTSTDKKSAEHTRTNSLDVNAENLLKDFKIDAEDFLLFDAASVYLYLCRESTLKIDETTNQSNTSNISNKRYSLELILVALKNSGQNFRNNECFMEITRKYLFISITQNSISTTKALFKVCVNIFLLLLEKFRSNLKVQISVFFDVIFHILEINNHLTDQVAYVLDELVNIFQKFESITVIFINYDCDLESNNIFERLIGAICYIAKNPIKTPSSLNSDFNQNNNAGKNKTESSIRNIALRCLTTILNSMEKEEKATNSYTNIISSETRSNAQDIKEANINPSNESLSAVKERKELLQEGISMFNSKPNKGVLFFQRHNFFDNEPKSVAKFLKEESRLDLTKIGEYLGELNEYNLKVMHCYVEQFNVTGTDFLIALRYFLSNFRLPGESQKIDRLMEKFAGHYFESNPNCEHFKTADAAYILAYSIIMLTTDLHNPMVKTKITPEIYIEMNKNSSGDSNISEEYLINIYNSIAQKGIELRSNYSLTKQINHTELNKETTNKEFLDITNKAVQRMEEISTMTSSFVETECLEIGKSIYNTIWKYLVVCFGCVFQEVEDPSIYMDCLHGIRQSIRLSCVYGLELARNTFIKSLISFSMLGNNSTVSEIRRKNMEAIIILLMVAKEDGNYLGVSWYDILQCISNMEKFEVFGASSFDSNKFMTSDTKSLNHNNLQIENDHANSRIASFLSETGVQSIIVSVDLVFSSSPQLDSDSIVTFINCICKISLLELTQSKCSSFMLQKIVEVAYYNITRTRFEWNRIWCILGPYFIKAASLENENIAKSCIDSLRQLANKFLAREEYGNYHFQEEFLRPFEHIMIHIKYFGVKEMGIRCIQHIVQSQANNIKSGWTIVFNVLYHASLQGSEVLEELAFQSIHSIIDRTFNVIVEWFDKVLLCIKAFSCNSQSETFNVRAVHQLGLCFERYYLHISNYTKSSEKENKAMFNSLWNKGWKPIIVTLVEIIQYTCSYVRAEALLLLFNILKNNTDHIQLEWWPDLFKTLHTIFFILNKDEEEFSRKQKTIWLTETCTGALMGTLELYIVNYENLPLVVSKDMLNHLKWCIDQDFEILGATALFSFRRLVKLLSSKFDVSSWEEVLTFIKYILNYTIPDIFFVSSNCAHESAIMLTKTFDSCDNLTNKAQSLSLWDYSSYNVESLRRIAPLLLVERDNSNNEEILKIHKAFSQCRLDLEFQDGLKSLLDKNEENVNHPAEMVHKNPVLSNMPISLMWELCKILDEHQNKLKTFNINSKIVSAAAIYVESVSPALKQLWKGKIHPKLITQECLSLSCIAANMRLIAYSCDFSDECINSIIIHCIEIFNRWPQLLLDSIDTNMCYELLNDVLKFIYIFPEEKFKKCMSKLYGNLCTLINLKHTETSIALLSNIFLRLEKYMSLL